MKKITILFSFLILISAFSQIDAFSGSDEKTVEIDKKITENIENASYIIPKSFKINKNKDEIAKLIKTYFQRDIENTYIEERIRFYRQIIEDENISIEDILDLRVGKGKGKERKKELKKANAGYSHKDNFMKFPPHFFKIEIDDRETSFKKYMKGLRSGNKEYTLTISRKVVHEFEHQIQDKFFEKYNLGFLYVTEDESLAKLWETIFHLQTTGQRNLMYTIFIRSSRTNQQIANDLKAPLFMAGYRRPGIESQILTIEDEETRKIIKNFYETQINLAIDTLRQLLNAPSNEPEKKYIILEKKQQCSGKC